MLNALKGLSNSEKAIFCIALILAATVFVALGKMTVADWTAYTEVIAGIYVGGKSIQGAAAAVANGKLKNGVSEKPVVVEPAPKPKKASEGGK